MMTNERETHFTPGPWEVDHRDWAHGRGFWWEIICEKRDATVVELADVVIPPIAWSRNPAGEIPPAENLANAHLISAAPDLYEALAAVVGEMRREHDAGDGHFSTAEVEAAERALAKARGEVRSS